MYPEQIAEGLRPWQPKKLYFSGGAPGGRLTPVNTGAYDPLLGRTYSEIGGDARSYHKCQGVGGIGGGFGGGRAPAPAAGRGGGYSLVDTTVAGAMEKSESTLLDGIDTSLTGIAQYAGANPPRALTGALSAILTDAKAAQKAFADGNDAGAAAPAEAGLTAIRALRAQLAGMGLDDSAGYEIDFRLRCARRARRYVRRPGRRRAHHRRAGRAVTIAGSQSRRIGCLGDRGRDRRLRRAWRLCRGRRQ
jgi:hypothetical protein